MIILCVSRDQLHARDAAYNRYEIVFPGDPRNKATHNGGVSYGCGGCACGPECNYSNQNRCVVASRADQKAGGIWIRKETP